MDSRLQQVITGCQKYLVLMGRLSYDAKQGVALPDTPLLPNRPQAVAQAHASLAPGQLSISSTQLLGVSINRSPSAYANNPAEERARYNSDTDKTMTLVKLTDLKGNGRGLMAFYGAHPTSMNNDNQLLSGDTYGAAEQLMEKGWGKATAAGNSSFVAAMIQANHADTSPNTQGAFCGHTGAARTPSCPTMHSHIACACL
jgi:neutral ceramidase